MKFVFSIVFLFTGFLNASDILINAMKDEMKRGIEKLQMENFSKPYFLSYTVYESSICKISGIFGDLEKTRYEKRRLAKIDLRIGSKKFDNSYFIVGFKDRVFYDNITIEDDYDSIRKGLWYLTDLAYKEMLEVYSKKEAYRKKKNILEQYNDLSDEIPSKYFEDEVNDDFTCSDYEGVIKKASEIFRDYPSFLSSSVRLTYKKRNVYFVNSEGSSYKKSRIFINVDVRYELQNRDGYKTNDYKRFVFGSKDEINEKLIDEIRKYVDDISKNYNSKIIDYYLGPVIIEDEASAVFFNNLFVKNISYYPVPEIEDEDWLEYCYFIPKLVDRLNKRVLPGFITIYDDPGVTTYYGKKLIGYDNIDDEGVKTKKIELVENGYLKNIYTSRKPSKYSNKSNGHGRGYYDSFVYPYPYNVFIRSQKMFDYDELYLKAFDFAKEQNLDKILVIKKFYSDKGFREILPQPSLAYLLDIKTKEKQYIFPSKFEGVSLRSLRDIVITSKEEYVYNFFQDSPYGDRDSVPVSIICPKAIVLSEFELIKPEQKPEKLPYIEHPYFRK